MRERQAEQKQLLVDLFRIQDHITAEITRAHAGYESAVVREGEAEQGLQEARLAYEGTLEELGKIDRENNVPIVVRRPLT